VHRASRRAGRPSEPAGNSAVWTVPFDFPVFATVNAGTPIALDPLGADWTVPRPPGLACGDQHERPPIRHTPQSICATAESLGLKSRELHERAERTVKQAQAAITSARIARSSVVHRDCGVRRWAASSHDCTGGPAADDSRISRCRAAPHASTNGRPRSDPCPRHATVGDDGHGR